MDAKRAMSRRNAWSSRRAARTRIGDTILARRGSDAVGEPVAVARYGGLVIDETMIDEAGRRLSEAAPPGTRVVLFGSHARGEADSHSNLDFLVIEPEVENAALESVRLRRALGGSPDPDGYRRCERAAESRSGATCAEASSTRLSADGRELAA